MPAPDHPLGTPCANAARPGLGGPSKPRNQAPPPHAYGIRVDSTTVHCATTTPPHDPAPSSGFRLRPAQWGLPQATSSQQMEEQLNSPLSRLVDPGPAMTPVQFSPLSLVVRRSTGDRHPIPRIALLTMQYPPPPPLQVGGGSVGVGAHERPQSLSTVTAPSILLDTNKAPQPTLPCIGQVERQYVTTFGIQEASTSRRQHKALFTCPVPGCESSFTRRLNLQGHIRAHSAERPFRCEWPGCDKGFARHADRKRHFALHSRARLRVCKGCGKQFSRMDVLQRHLRSEAGIECFWATRVVDGSDQDGSVDGGRNVSNARSEREELA